MQRVNKKGILEGEKKIRLKGKRMAEMGRSIKVD